MTYDPDETYFLPKIANVQQIRGRKSELVILHISNPGSVKHLEEEETVCYSSMQRSSVRTVTGFYTENTSKKDLVRLLGGISIGHTLVLIDINFDQKR